MCGQSIAAVLRAPDDLEAADQVKVLVRGHLDVAGGFSTSSTDIPIYVPFFRPAYRAVLKASGKSGKSAEPDLSANMVRAHVSGLTSDTPLIVVTVDSVATRSAVRGESSAAAGCAATDGVGSS